MFSEHLQHRVIEGSRNGKWKRISRTHIWRAFRFSWIPIPIPLSGGGSGTSTCSFPYFGRRSDVKTDRLTKVPVTTGPRGNQTNLLAIKILNKCPYEHTRKAAEKAVSNSEYAKWEKQERPKGGGWRCEERKQKQQRRESGTNNKKTAVRQRNYKIKHYHKRPWTWDKYTHIPYVSHSRYMLCLLGRVRTRCRRRCDETNWEEIKRSLR